MSPRPVCKVLYLQSTSEISGSDLTLLRLIEVLDRKRFEPHVVLPRSGPLVDAYRKAGCQLHFVPSMRKLTSRRGAWHISLYLSGYMWAVLRIARLIRRERINLVHTNTIHNLYGFLAAQLTRTPHVWHVREIVVQSAVVRLIEAHLVKWYSDRFIVMDDPIAEMFRTRNGRFPPNLVKLYDGIDLDAFHPTVSGERIRRELGVLESTPLVGIVCRLDPAKGLDIFLDAAADIHRVRPDTRFLVCGGEIEGHEGFEAKLRQRAARAGVQEAVLFTSWQYRHQDIPEVYGALDVSVQCPINPEAYGLANIEAMASGVPVVAVAEGGPTELCVQGETAWLVPPRDPHALAEAVLSLLRDPARRQAMGIAGRRRAEVLFDRKQCVGRLESLYDEILETRC